MAARLGNAVVPNNQRGDSRSSADGPPLQEHSRRLQDLLEAPPEEVAKTDVGLLNLLCAPALPGSEHLDISKCLARLDDLAAFVRAGTERNLHRFPTDPTHHHSIAQWRMGMLITLVKRDYGAAYSPSAVANLEAGIEAPFADSREIFIHGLLDDDRKRRWGTCTSIPVFVAAVARRLRYPLRVAVARRHVYCRWDENGRSFNVEASNPAGMTTPSDESYRSFRGGLDAEEQRSGFYLRPLSAREEFALFLTDRVFCLYDAKRYDETLLWSARALQFAPDAPHFPKFARHVQELALRHRLARVHPEMKVPPPEEPFRYNAGELLRVEERSLYCTIMGHAHEGRGDIEAARAYLEDACRQNFHGNNEQSDLQRLLQKHSLPKKHGPLIWPKDIGQHRRIRLSSSPEEEAPTLRRIADELERRGQLLQARDALHDLYLFDPCDAEVFHRARALERRPQFQTQLRQVIAVRQRLRQQAGIHYRN